METNDPVDHPAHYNKHPSGIECIEVVQHMGFNLGNAVKYVWRADHKGDNPLQDLRKAAWYLDREITRLEQVEAELEAAKTKKVETTAEAPPQIEAWVADRTVCPIPCPTDPQLAAPADGGGWRARYDILYRATDWYRLPRLPQWLDSGSTPDCSQVVAIPRNPAAYAPGDTDAKVSIWSCKAHLLGWHIATRRSVDGDVVIAVWP